MTKNKTIQNGRFHFYMASASDLQLKNPLLDKGQQVFEADTLLGKLGDGVRRWKELPYASYIHPLTPGNKHIPAGGAADQFLGWDSNGVAKWVSIPLSYFGITATAGEINYLKALTGPVQSQLNGKAPTLHTHTKSQITDFPASLPANGGNADTVDGKHAADLQNYENLTNKPSTFPPSSHTHLKSQITDFPASIPADGGNSDTVDGKHAADLQNYNNLTNKPSTFPPSSHNHTKAQITDFPTSLPANGGNADTVDGKHASDLQNYNNLTNKPSSFPPSGHTHTKSQITDFPSSLPADGGTASYSNYLNANNIASNTNLNDLTTPGFYYCPANATVGTLANSPTTNAFFLIVGMHAGAYQEIVEYITGNPKRFMRNQYSGTWGSWYRVFTTGNVPTYSEVGAAPSSHYHDDRYYTESEITSLLTGKAASNHNHAGVYEPVFSKNNAFNKSFGTAAGTVCQGNDSRLSDARTPMAHTHTKGQITDFPASMPANGGNSDTVDGKHATAFFNLNTANYAPYGTSFLSSSSSSAGYMIKLPFNTNASKMVCFTLNIYGSYQHYKVICSGYLYASTNQWHSPQLTLMAGTSSIQVVLGRADDGKAYVWIPAKDYIGISVTDITGGYSNADWNTGWTIVATNTYPNVALNTTLSMPVYSNDARLSNARPANGGNADTVDGFHASQTPGSKSTAVVTNSSGYLMAGYINTNVSVENPAIGAVFVQNSAGDGYVRKASLAHLKTALKVGTVYVQAAQPAGLANGDLWFKTITI